MPCWIDCVDARQDLALLRHADRPRICLLIGSTGSERRAVKVTRGPISDMSHPGASTNRSVLLTSRRRLRSRAACYAGDMSSVELLVQAGANVNDAENNFKVTPLIIVAESDHPLVITYLVRHGANLEWKERGGYTALSRALFKKHGSAIEALLRSGATCQPEATIGGWARDCVEHSAAIPK